LWKDTPILLLKYGLPQILPEQINFYTWGRAVLSVIMPKNRIDHAYLLAMQPDTIFSNSRGYDKSARGVMGVFRKARSKRG